MLQVALDRPADGRIVVEARMSACAAGDVSIRRTYWMGVGSLQADEHPLVRPERER